MLSNPALRIAKTLCVIKTNRILSDQMIYDWEKIFVDKTNKELYDIVTGIDYMSEEAVNYAKIELNKRNFDFENMEANRAAWELSRLVEEEDFARLEITGRRAKHISIKILVLIIPLIFSIYFVLSKFPEYDFPLGVALFFSGLAIALILLNNFQAIKQKQAQNKRLERIKKLKDKLENKNLLTEESPITNEINRHRIKEMKGIKGFSYSMIVLSVIMILIYILSRIF